MAENTSNNQCAHCFALMFPEEAQLYQEKWYHPSCRQIVEARDNQQESCPRCQREVSKTDRQSYVLHLNRFYHSFCFSQEIGEVEHKLKEMHRVERFPATVKETTVTVEKHAVRPETINCVICGNEVRESMITTTDAEGNLIHFLCLRTKLGSDKEFIETVKNHISGMNPPAPTTIPEPENKRGIEMKPEKQPAADIRSGFRLVNARCRSCSFYLDPSPSVVQLKELIFKVVEETHDISFDCPRRQLVVAFENVMYEQ